MPVSIGVNMRVTGHYSQGGRKYMEDKFSVAYQPTEDEKDLEYAYFGIFDGHGGSEAADYAKEHLMDSIVKQKQFWSEHDEDVLRAIRNGYMMTHMNMWKELDKWPKTVAGLPSTAGTTASVAFIRGGKIYIGHVGDSAIVLGYQVEGQEKWSAKSLTSDHKPDCTAEMDRIHTSGGKVVAKAGVHRVVWNRPAMGPGGSLRCDEIPFLAVARSLGDLWSYNPNSDEFIVSPDPDVGVLVIDPSKYRCLIFGTDGLWNMVSAEAAVQLVQAAEKHNEKAPPGAPPPDAWLNPSKILVDCALQRWSCTKMRADNTSVVTLMMDPPGPPKNRSSNPPLHGTHAHQESTPCAGEETQNSRRPASEPAVETRTSPSPEATPTRSLSIMKRFPDERPPPPPPLSQPFCYSSNQEEEETLITNYGSPSESYFIARLLNKTQIRNTLEDVYQEIVARVGPGESSLSATSVLQRTSIVPLTEGGTDNQDAGAVAVVKALDEETLVQNVESRGKGGDGTNENIQINEVSSSSPLDAPTSCRSKKSKNATTHKPSEAYTPLCRSLRSHDTPPTSLAAKPQTRQANKGSVTRSRNSNGESKVPTGSTSSGKGGAGLPSATLTPRITRSKDSGPPPVQQGNKKPPGPQQPKTDVEVNARRQGHTGTRQRSSGGVAVTQTFLSKQTAAAESDSSKENIVAPSTSVGPLKSAKRRNSGGGATELEPKVKRRTRLEDKRKADKVVLGISVASVVLHCLSEEEKAGKCRQARSRKEGAVPSPLHSTTINAENVPLHADTKANGALRSRQENHQSKGEDEKRCLRSADRSTQLNHPETRLILRSRNSVSGVTPKVTPRRMRNPWALATRQNLRKRFSK